MKLAAEVFAERLIANADAWYAGTVTFAEFGATQRVTWEEIQRDAAMSDAVLALLRAPKKTAYAPPALSPAAERRERAKIARRNRKHAAEDCRSINAGFRTGGGR